MQRRLVIIVLVFVAGFGVGYGITWLLVGSGETASSARRDDETPAATADTRRPERGGRDADEARADAAPAPAADAEVRAAGDTVAAVVSAEADAGSSDTAQAGGEVAGQSGHDDDARADEDWQRCHGKVCRVDFGRVSGGISIRKGSLVHEQPVDWDRDFAKADKVGTLEVGDDVRVEVLAVGLTAGEPAAAYIAVKSRRTSTRGVIALRIGDKVLRLVPLEP